MTKFTRAACLLVSFLVLVTIIAVSSRASGAMVKPSYLAGDRWVYVLQGSLTSFPGFNASQTGTFHFGILGQVDVNVIGLATVVSRGSTIAAVHVDTRTSGFLNGTFPLPGGGGTAQVTGTITTSTTEFWEDGSYFVLQSNGTTSYLADVTYFGLTTPLVVHIRLNTTTSIATIPPFALDVGQNATAHLDTSVDLNSTFTAFTQTRSYANQTNVSSNWRREVVSAQNVAVEAGTFSTYRLNQTLSSFPGIPGGITGGGNESAYFSNDVGYYAKRVAYSNGTPAAEMRLKSYTYGANRPMGLSIIQTAFFIIVPVVIVVLIAIVIWRRRKGPIQEGASPPTASEEIGRKGGGNDGAR